MGGPHEMVQLLDNLNQFRLYLLSWMRACHVSLNVLANTGLFFDKAAMFRDTIIGTHVFTIHRGSCAMY
jgi:hypothetical protein